MVNVLKNNAAAIAAMILLVIVVLLLQQKCGGDILPADSYSYTVTDTIKGDPYPVYLPVKTPIPVEVQVPTIVELPADIDTMAVISDYFSKIFYSDTIRNDSSMLVVINDSVFANRIFARQPILQNRRPTAIVTTTNVSLNRQEAKFKLYMGLGAGYTPTFKRFSIGPSVTATIRAGGMLGYYYDIPNNAHQIRFEWKLQLRRQRLSFPKTL